MPRRTAIIIAGAVVVALCLAISGCRLQTDDAADDGDHLATPNIEATVQAALRSLAERQPGPPPTVPVQLLKPRSRRCRPPSQQSLILPVRRRIQPKRPTLDWPPRLRRYPHRRTWRGRPWKSRLRRRWSGQPQNFQPRPLTGPTSVRRRRCSREPSSMATSTGSWAPRRC